MYGPALSQEDRTWAMLGHLLAAAGLLVGIAGWIGPLVVWLIERDRSRFAAFHAAQSLFFQLVWIPILAVGWFLTVTLMAVLIGFLLIPVMIGVSLVPLIWAIVAGMKANAGQDYEYPIVGAWVRRSVAPYP